MDVSLVTLTLGASEKISILVDIQGVSSGELLRAGDSRILAWQAAFQAWALFPHLGNKELEQSCMLK